MRGARRRNTRHRRAAIRRSRRLCGQGKSVSPQYAATHPYTHACVHPYACARTHALATTCVFTHALKGGGCDGADILLGAARELIGEAVGLMGSQGPDVMLACCILHVACFTVVVCFMHVACWCMYDAACCLYAACSLHLSCMLHVCWLLQLRSILRRSLLGYK